MVRGFYTAAKTFESIKNPTGFNGVYSAVGVSNSSHWLYDFILRAANLYPPAFLGFLAPFVMFHLFLVVIFYKATFGLWLCVLSF